ncbi:hypothetical protein N9L68_03755 [bacterium]|nr:hypothetical protein [bacterium]
MAPVVCLFCDSSQGGDFFCEKISLSTGRRTMAGDSITASMPCISIRNDNLSSVGKCSELLRAISEFLARGALGWNNFVHAMVAAAASPEGLPRAMPWGRENGSIAYSGLFEIGRNPYPR